MFPPISIEEYMRFELIITPGVAFTGVTVFRTWFGAEPFCTYKKHQF